MLIFKDCKGESGLEMVLLLALVAMIVIVILALLGPSIGALFTSVMAAL